MKLCAFICWLGVAVSACNTGASPNTEEKVDSLLSVMTLREKIGQLNQYSVGAEMTGPVGAMGSERARFRQIMNGEVGSVLNLTGAEVTYKLQKRVMDSTRLKIPLLFAFDVIHGYQTIFPIPLAESCSWNLELIQTSAQMAARESAAAGIGWTFAPMVDVSRDARWGRVMEGAGEDPYLGSQIAVARIRGFQGDDLSDATTVAACAKHFAGYGFAESGREYNATSFGPIELHNTILPPFKSAAQAGVATFMNGFNTIDRIPATAHTHLLREVLRSDWMWKGVVVSDWNSIGELIEHGVAVDLAEAAEKAIVAGSDVDMQGAAYIDYLEALVKEGRVDEAWIDEAARRVLKLKFDLGLFEDPFKYHQPAAEKKWVGHPEHHAHAHEMATESIVLLKNEEALLPLDHKRIAVIGPLVKDKDSPLGSWRARGEPHSAVSLWEGLRKAMPDVELTHAQGCALAVGEQSFTKEIVIEDKDRSGFAEAVALAKKSDVVIMALGEPAFLSGEARSRAEIGLPGLQQDLLEAVYDVNPNVVLVVMSGRPLAIPWAAEKVPAIVQAWHLGSQAGHALADVLTGKVNPSGKLTMSVPRMVGQLPIYYNYLSTGRPERVNDLFYSHYEDVDRSPLYPFGHGLSYTRFEYKHLKVKPTDAGVEVSITVTNAGSRAGKEVVQVYLRDLVASISRPVKELKAFRKILLEPGASRTLSFELDQKDLSYLDAQGHVIFEPGTFEIFVGTNSVDVLSEKFTLE